jgi:hypothetical protein
MTRHALDCETCKEEDMKALENGHVLNDTLDTIASSRNIWSLC